MKRSSKRRERAISKVYHLRKGNQTRRYSPIKRGHPPNSVAVLICIKENNLLKPFVLLKQKGDPAFTYEIQFEIKDNKFYFFSAIDNTPILIATRVDLSEIQNYIEKATPAL